jgi:hypothetical protein
MPTITTEVEVHLEDLDDWEIESLVKEAKEKGLAGYVPKSVHERALEDAYEALLRGDHAGAQKTLQQVLVPHGGYDSVRHRVMSNPAKLQKAGAQ